MFISNSGSRGYQIANSLRLRSSASAYLSRTFSAGSQQQWTFSFWFKRGTVGVIQEIMGLAQVSPNQKDLRISSDDTLFFYTQESTTVTAQLVTTRVFRDPSAWYHAVLVLDTPNATSTDRLRLYINGVRETAFSTATYPSLNANIGGWNTAIAHYIGQFGTSAQYWDGYFAEMNWVGGQALTPSSFGQTDTNGVWVPKAYSGTYGTNGFYLKFNDGSSTTNLCLDRSGNGNNWTPNNISVTAGATYDWMVDTPTNNYAVLNPLTNYGAVATLSNANLDSYILATTGQWRTQNAGVHLNGSRTYFEVYITTTFSAGNAGFGIGDPSSNYSGNVYPGQFSNGFSYASNGNKTINNVTSAYGAAWTTGDTIGVDIDLLAGSITFYKNGVSQGVLSSSLNTGFTYVLIFGSASGAPTQYSVNFGQRPFTYTPPTGSKALCTANLPAVTIAKPNQHFDIKTRTGTGASANITGYSFSPDLVWIKSRGRAIDNTLYDRLRGTQARLESNTTDAEVTADAGLTAFNSDGYTLNTLDQVNGTTATNSFVDWAWKANGAGVTNTSGSITSTVSANTTAGFSIVTFNSGTAGNKTVGHGLGVTPAMVIVKDRETAATQWWVWHKSFSNTAQNYLYLHTTNAVLGPDSRIWANAAPTSSVFSFESGYTLTASKNTVAYVFSEVPGFSRFGSYTGNGSADGSFVYLGFRARYLLIKNSSSAGNHWIIIDTARDTYNLSIYKLGANVSAAENDAGTVGTSSNNMVDILSNGFKLRSTNGDTNGTGTTYIFAAFAESPFGASNTAPATAR